MKNLNAESPTFCISVGQLKKQIKNWTEKYPNGDDTLVYLGSNSLRKKKIGIGCGKCDGLTKLNVEYDENGNEYCGILLTTNRHD